MAARSVLVLAALFLLAIHPQGITQAPSEDAWATFIIPIKGHPSLETTLASLRNQTDGRWTALLVSPSPIAVNSSLLLDPRVRFHHLPHLLELPHCLGFAFSRALVLSNTTWVAFLQEGDVVAAHYLEELVAEGQRGTLDVFIARTHDADRWPLISPPLANSTIFLQGVTYGFALRVGATTAALLENYDVLQPYCQTSLWCVVSASVLYFTGNVRGLPSGERTVIPHTPPKGLRELSKCNALAARIPCGLQHPKPPHPKGFSFLLREEHSVYFHHNVKALRWQLHRAVREGCLGTSAPLPVTTVMFEHKTKPKGKHIHLQVEQHTSHHFTPTYIAKLESASQVWETTVGGAARLAARVPSLGQRLFIVPTYLYAQLENPEFSCPPTANAPMEGMAICYMDGCYFHWHYTNHTHQRLLNVHPSPGRTTISCNTTAPAHPEDEADVLFYGAMEGSFHNLREKLCDNLRAAGMKIVCLGAMGKVLQHHLCRVKVVVVEHFYAAAATELHRIDALLAAGHRVISVPPGLNDDMVAYRGLVTFTKRSQMVQTVVNVLQKWSVAPHNRSATSAAFRHLVEDSRPLCYALCLFAGGGRQRAKKR